MPALIVRYELVRQSEDTEERLVIDTTLREGSAASQAEVLREITEAAAAALVLSAESPEGSGSSLHTCRSHGDDGIGANPDAVAEIDEGLAGSEGRVEVGLDGQHVSTTQEEFVSSHSQSAGGRDAE